VARLGLAESVVSVLPVLGRLAAVVLLCIAMAGAQEFFWPPSTPEGEPHIDHTRKVLRCNGGGCELTVVRSQGELLRALIGTPQAPMAGAQEKGAAHVHGNASNKNAPQQDKAAGRADGLVQPQVRLNPGIRLILGGCFGGELPMSLVDESTAVTIPPEAEERMKAATAMLQERQPLLNSRSSPKAVGPGAQVPNVR
jgi:hypothetical protein